MPCVKSAIDRIIPRDRHPGMIPGPVFDEAEGKPFRHAHARHQVINKMADRIFHLPDVFKITVCQTDFLSHVNERCPIAHIHHCRKHRCSFIAVFFDIDCKAVHAAGIVVVFQDKCVPAFLERRSLRIKEALLELAQVKWFGEEFLSTDIIGVKMSETKDRIQLTVALPHIFPCIFH